MAVVSDDEGMSEPEILTTDSESDPETMSDDDLQPFTLPDLGDDLPTTDGILDENHFVIPTPVHDHLIIDHSDGEHVVAPNLTHVPLVAIPLEDLPFDDLIDIDVDWLTTMSAAPIPPHDLEPDFIPDDLSLDTPADPELMPVPEPLPDHDPISFGIPDITPLIPYPVLALVDPPVIEPLIPPLAPAPADGITTPCLGKDTSGQQPSHDLHVSAAYPHIPMSAPFAPFTSSPTNDSFRGSPQYSMPTSDPYHPSHFVGYTHDELLYSLQFRFEVMSRRVLELESIPHPLPCPCQHVSVPLVPHRLHLHVHLLLLLLFQSLMLDSS
ncbi:hypothetical protein Hanom_Chr05g00449251 [Helianthus anomalus]